MMSTTNNGLKRNRAVMGYFVGVFTGQHNTAVNARYNFFPKSEKHEQGFTQIGWRKQIGDFYNQES